ncbi:MAG: nuclear transport factor 2 family protein [Acidimicrobiales bacterium]|nr:nuclear transport factor 2 family protein [Hyphomonadaceae bacterium]RZV40596.1 MAG: nuclear transport factor 2 family protein [Acidimicrobiales bacterium]
MLSHRVLSDRLEIQDLLVAYCEAIDSGNWEVLDDIFTPDAYIDYTSVGGAKGNLQEIKSYLAKALAQFPTYQHMLGLPQIKIDGDTATARTICFNPMTIDKDGAPHVFFVGVWYVDELRRTDQGWRIAKRLEELSYFHNFPSDFKPVDPDG